MKFCVWSFAFSALTERQLFQPGDRLIFAGFVGDSWLHSPLWPLWSFSFPTAGSLCSGKGNTWGLKKSTGSALQLPGDRHFPCPKTALHPPPLLHTAMSVAENWCTWQKKKSLFISRYIFVAPSCHSATSFFVCIKSIRKLSMLTVLPASVPVLTSILCPQKNNQGKIRDWSHTFSMLPSTWRLCLCSGWRDYC